MIEKRRGTPAMTIVMILITVAATATSCSGNIRRSGDESTGPEGSAASPPHSRITSESNGVPGGVTADNTDAYVDPIADLSSCTAESLDLHTPGVLTLATGLVVGPPWVLPAQDVTVSEDDPAGTGQRIEGDPTSRRGYDAAVGYAVAERLGFTTDQVEWVRSSFSDAIVAGEKPYDMFVNQASIRPERRVAVDLTTAYYTPRPILVAREGSPAVDAETASDLGTLRVVVIEGSDAARMFAGHDPQLAAASVEVVADRPDVRPLFGSGTVDALVADAATVQFFLASPLLLPGAVPVAQLPRPDAGTDTFGLVLERDSPLTPCVNAALVTLREDGTLDELEDRWLVDEVGLPILG